MRFMLPIATPRYPGTTMPRQSAGMWDFSQAKVKLRRQTAPPVDARGESFPNV